MQKLLAAIVASTFAFGSLSTFAADAVKREELTQDQRSDMRTRADQLSRSRATGSEHVTKNAENVPVNTKKQVTKRKTTKRTVKKTEPKS
jgi:hypothetical protein